MQATSDKTASANFTQSAAPRYDNVITNSVTGDAYGKTGYNPYFQWGRKDAFRSNEYTDAPAEGTSLIYKADSVSVGTTIKNPTIHYYCRYNPYNPYYYNAWNAIYAEYAGTSTENIPVLEKTVKTVYDPCPVGYTVPPANTFYGFTTSNCIVDGNGRLYTDSITRGELYIPEIGYRDYQSAVILGEPIYATSVSGESNRARTFYFKNNTIFRPINPASARADGMLIRPVREN